MNKNTLGVIILLSVLTFACAFLTPAPPTPTPTSVPPTVTRTSIPPTATATSIPPTETPVANAIPSVESSLVSVKFMVVNESGTSLDLSWLDWQQNRGASETDYATIPAGESYEQQSYFADAWLLRDLAGNIVLFFFATEDDGKIITITAEAVAVAKTNAFTDAGLASIPGMENLSAANTNFVNNSSIDLNVFWIDVEGNRQLVGTIPAGGNLEVRELRFGNMLIVTNAAGNSVLVYTATEGSPQTVTVSEAAVAFRFGIDP
jgi:hypothetical protein